MVSPFLFNTEQYSLYSCNMISRVEVRNITDKLLGVKISLLRMASGGFFKHKYFSKVFKFIVSSNFNVRIRIKKEEIIEKKEEEERVLQWKFLMTVRRQYE